MNLSYNKSIAIVGGGPGGLTLARLLQPSGEGVNMAMLDAVELSDCLTGNDFPDVVSAIACYETNMRQRASETAAVSMESTAGLHGDNGIGYLLRIIGQD